MPTSTGWYLIGPLIAVGLVGFLGILFWRMGLRPTTPARPHDPATHGLTIFGEPDDYGLLFPAAITTDPETADEIRHVLDAAGIRATQAVGRDGRTAVLVFAEEVEAARRLVGDLPAL